MICFSEYRYLFDHFLSSCIIESGTRKYKLHPWYIKDQPCRVGWAPKRNSKRLRVWGLEWVLSKVSDEIFTERGEILGSEKKKEYIFSNCFLAIFSTIFDHWFHEWWIRSKTFVKMNGNLLGHSRTTPLVKLLWMLVRTLEYG